jgi:hypothetical protein
MSVLELVIATALAGIVLAVVFPFLNFSPNALRADAQELSAVLTSAWSLSTSRVTHYRVRVASTTEFVLERGQLVGSTWVFTVERTVPLHSGIQFVAADVTATCGLVAGAGRCAEFQSRGGLAGVTALDLGPIFTLTDTRRGWTRQIKVWGTGLVEML